MSIQMKVLYQDMYKRETVKYDMHIKISKCTSLVKFVLNSYIMNIKSYTFY